MAAEQIKVINYVLMHINEIDLVRFDTTVKTPFGLFHSRQIGGREVNTSAAFYKLRNGKRFRTLVFVIKT